MRYLALLLLLALTSCSNYYYAPNSHNVPLFKEKNEARLAVKGITGDELSGVEVQGAYSLADNVGIIANYATASGGGEGTQVSKGSGNLAEFGVGYYKEVVPNLVFETYGGAGFGKVSNTYADGSNYEGQSRINISRFFLQPSIGYASNVFDAAFSTRIAFLRYSNMKFTNSPFTTPFTYSEINYINSNPNALLFEPSLTLRLGWKFIKFQLQTTYSFNASNSIPMRNLTISGGIFLSFAPRFTTPK